MEVPHINITINETDIENGALSILQQIRPNWDQKKIQFKLLTDGITNKLVGCKPEDSPESETVLVRVYGNKTDLLIDRKAETRNIRLLNKYNLAPELYATFENGLAYRFVPGTTLKVDTVTDPKIYKLVAKRLANLHKVKVPDMEVRPCLWEKIKSFWNLIPDEFSDKNKDKLYKETVISKVRILEEIEYLKEILVKLKSPVVFAHNDLLLGNVIYTEEENKVTFIDYEYAALNYQAFDIGNHFAEFIGIDNVDITRYPNKNLQMDWLRTYLEEYNGVPPTDIEIERLYVQVNQFNLITHVFWGIWSLIQAEYSNIEFNFLEYAALRFSEYFAKKESFLALQLPPCSSGFLKIKDNNFNC